MAASARPPLFCTRHPVEVAQTICIRHNSFLCLTCALEKAKLNDCEVKEMRTLKESDNILLDLLLARQQVTEMLGEHIKYVEKAQTQKEQFTKTVIDFHAQLIKQLDEKKGKSIAKINEETKTILNFSREQMPKLKELESQINENIKRFSEQSAENLSNMDQHLERIKTKLTEVAGITSNPEGHCKPYTGITETVSKSEQLADIMISDDSFYEEIANAENKEDAENEKQKKSKIIKRANKTGVELRQDKEGKSEKPTKRFLSWFGKGKSETRKERDTKSLHEEYTTISLQGEDEIYQEAPFMAVTSVHPKQLVNKTLTVPELKESFSSACKFSKLVFLGENRIALLSQAHSAVVIVGLDAKVIYKKTFKEPTVIGIAEIDNDQIAVLHGQSQIVKYRISPKGFDINGSFQIEQHPDFNSVLEFDYHKQKAQFAVTSLAEITIFDKLGKVVKEKPFDFQELGDSVDIVTKYDFENDRIYVINREFNTFTCYSFPKAKVLWKKRLDVNPNSVCLFKENICLTTDNIILMFSLSTGQPTMQYEVNDLVEKCFGVCVVDDVMIVSSGSDDMEKSTRFGFVRI